MMICLLIAPFVHARITFFRLRPASTTVPDGGEPIAVHTPHTAALDAHLGRQVCLGLRPEHLSNTTYVPAPTSTAVLPRQVRLIELMGDHQYVYLRHGPGDGTLTMKCDSHYHVRVVENITVAVATTRAHVFDGIAKFARNLTLP